jgi:hypothetical protein
MSFRHCHYSTWYDGQGENMEIASKSQFKTLLWLECLTSEFESPAERIKVTKVFYDLSFFVK